MNAQFNIPGTSQNMIDFQNESVLVFHNSEDISLDPASEEVIAESKRLYLHHLAREMAGMGIRFPLENSEYITASQHTNSLQILVNKFVTSPQRGWVHEKAQSVDLETLNFHTFQQLLYGLFQEGGITWERVLVLFYFCTDLSIRALQEKVLETFIRIYNWTTCYISTRLSVWIEQHGGWGMVLQNSINYATSLSILGFCCIGILAICVYIRNNK